MASGPLMYTSRSAQSARAARPEIVPWAVPSAISPDVTGITSSQG